MTDKQISYNVRRFITDELSHFLILQDKVPRSIKINIMYDESNASLDLNVDKIGKIFEKEKKSGENDLPSN